MPFVLANVFQPLIDLFEAALRFFHDDVGLGWGLSIIALTVVVRLILVPLTVKQMKSMQAMQKLAPEMKALQEKYKDDKQRQQQELMALYKEHQVNPFGSCLPLVAQMPVFLSLYYMLRKDLRNDICGDRVRALGQHFDAAKESCGSVHMPEHFLFVHDITDKATGGVLVGLIALYVGSQLLSGIFMSASVDRNQRLLMLGLPFVFTLFIIRFPAGLIVYWITTNLWTVGQGILVRRSLGIHVPHLPQRGAEAPAVAEPPPKGRQRVERAPAKPSAAEGPAASEPTGETEEPKPKRPSGPPPSARRKKKRSGRRR
ncbi:MAG TPA: membrane protein insertase YidC [Solirubrobacteraceae bacterium]|jgi:YidC/Oxa1 family membrane protein insertase|nr:membrane protein insertase YidC [Solirubrobacteraceae bacterium]